MFLRVFKFLTNVIFLLMLCMPKKKNSRQILEKNSRKCYSIEASEGEIYIGGFVLLKFIEPVMTGSMNFSNTKTPM